MAKDAFSLRFGLFGFDFLNFFTFPFDFLFECWLENRAFCISIFRKLKHIFRTGLLLSLHSLVNPTWSSKVMSLLLLMSLL